MGWLSTSRSHSDMELVDVHAHVVPRTFPAGPHQGIESRWPCMCHRDDGATITIDGKAFRELDARSWDPSIRIDDMDAMGVGMQAISPMPELLSYWFKPQVGLDMCRWTNEQLLEISTLHPGRFVTLASVPLQDPDLASRELAALKASGAVGVELGSNINGEFLGEVRFHEFFAEAQRLDLAIFIHALHPIGAQRLRSTPELVPFAAFPLDTALCAASIIRSGIPETLPDLRIGFSHGGGAIIPIVHRLGKGAEITNHFAGTLTESPAHYAARFYYDNLVYDPGYMAYLANEFAPGHVFCGTDYPYPIMATDPAGDIARAAPHDIASVTHLAARQFLNLHRD